MQGRKWVLNREGKEKFASSISLLNKSVAAAHPSQRIVGEGGRDRKILHPASFARWFEERKWAWLIRPERRLGGKRKRGQNNAIS